MGRRGDRRRSRLMRLPVGLRRAGQRLTRGRSTPPRSSGTRPPAASSRSIRTRPRRARTLFCSTSSTTGWSTRTPTAIRCRVWPSRGHSPTTCRSSRFTLRQGLTFADGEAFNAEAVKANLERAMEPDSITSPLLKAVDTVNVVDESTVELALNRPGAHLVLTLSDLPGMMVSPAAFANPEQLATRRSASAGSTCSGLIPAPGTSSSPRRLLGPGRAQTRRVHHRRGHRPGDGAQRGALRRVRLRAGVAGHDRAGGADSGRYGQGADRADADGALLQPKQGSAGRPPGPPGDQLGDRP